MSSRLCAGISTTSYDTRMRESPFAHFLHMRISPFALHRTTKNIPEFPVAPEMALELLMAANFLDA